MSTRFICVISNEAVLKALFKIKDDELTFAKVIETAIETKNIAKVAKETVCRQKQKHEINKILSNKKGKSASTEPQISSAECIRCGKADTDEKIANSRQLYVIIAVRSDTWKLFV